MPQCTVEKIRSRQEEAERLIQAWAEEQERLREAREDAQRAILEAFLRGSHSAAA